MAKTIFLISILSVALATSALSQKPYKGGECYSLSTWKYGKMEMRMKMVSGSGILSTFFTYKNGSERPGTFWEEIDIEVFGKDSAKKLQTNIITGNPREMSEEVHEFDFSLAENYHTYTLEWTPDYVAWYLDGREIRRTTGPQVADLKNPQSLRFNLWAASIEEWVGSFDTTVLPVYQFVNWFAFYEYTPGEGEGGRDFTFSWKDEFNNFNASRWGKANWSFDVNLVDFTPENVIVRDGYLILALTTAKNTGFSGTFPKDYAVPASGVPGNSIKYDVFPEPEEDN